MKTRSGARSEEVAFNRAKPRSPAPAGSRTPILDITEAPEAADIVLINRPELRPAGAGESSIRPVAAALGSASPSQSGC
jgi:nicotinate dehydrogenase subunit B